MVCHEDLGKNFKHEEKEMVTFFHFRLDKEYGVRNMILFKDWLNSKITFLVLVYSWLPFLFIIFFFLFLNFGVLCPLINVLELHVYR